MNEFENALVCLLVPIVYVCVYFAGKNDILGQLANLMQLKVTDYSSEKKIKDALEIAYRYSQIDGAHHKSWSIDQMVRALCGTEAEYKQWVSEYENNGEYDWDTGIAP